MKSYDNLTVSDVAYLKSVGYKAGDMDQIDRAYAKTLYTVYQNTSKGIRYKSVTADVASEILGRTPFLSGLGRSAFHWTSVREIGETEYEIGFDSSLLFGSTPSVYDNIGMIRMSLDELKDDISKKQAHNEELTPQDISQSNNEL